MKIRKDGKEQSVLFWLALLAGLLGIEYFYLKMKVQGLTKFLLSFVGGTIIVLTWTIYGGIENYNPASLPPVILGMSLFGGSLVIISFIWSFINAYLIWTGVFKDQLGVRVSQWDGTIEQYVNDLIEGEVK